jgi:hypothetical protein
MARAKTNGSATLSTPKRGPGKIRGVTPSQYTALARMVRRKETTWEQLEREGIVLPSQRESEFRRAVKRQLAK